MKIEIQIYSDTFCHRMVHQSNPPERILQKKAQFAQVIPSIGTEEILGILSMQGRNPFHLDTFFFRPSLISLVFHFEKRYAGHFICTNTYLLPSFFPVMMRQIHGIVLCFKICGMVQRTTLPFYFLYTIIWKRTL